ncbi:retron St85 family RNA-directed DNA polymerase [Endozoicomonas arenosclerae]|uniref:retron St85 family RNA-directed DNA polymerase n=1 Tax=Endozoicomonas arenosclerae TaxID=1633495 RepID=UPI00078031BF|nr:retron St85 family RNA-directed DNA polymerase [Endozoicomonas arenosclerae]
MNIKSIISNDLGIPEKLIEEALSSSRTYVKVFKIKKRNGGFREIHHPSKKLKTLQYWLIHNIFKNLSIHKSSVAYQDGVSILDNAKMHSSNRFFLKIDLENFFPSIKYTDLEPIVDKWHSENKISWELDQEAKELIRKSCFYKEDLLPIGYPSSPIISNAVMHDFDTAINQIILDNRFGETVYTRYADDLVFSTNKHGACSKLKDVIRTFIGGYNTPNIKINTSKTKMGSSTGGSASVTGLKVCENGHITIHRKQKDHIRLLLSLYAKGKLPESEKSSLAGHLAYVQHVAPSFYSSISNKYFKEIFELRATNV